MQTVLLDLFQLIVETLFIRNQSPQPLLRVLRANRDQHERTNLNTCTEETDFLMQRQTDADLQLLLQQCDFSDTRLSGLIGLFNFSPLSRQAESHILQFALQLALLIVLQMEEQQH